MPMPMEINTLGVLGGGQMGSGIAQVAAQSGIVVRLADSSAALAEASKGKLASTFTRLVEKGKLSAEAASSALAKINPVGSMEALNECDLIVEAVTENPELKAQLFQKLDQVARPNAVLATNTSSISITRIAAQTQAPGQSDRHALHEPGAGHAARGSHSRAANQRRDVRRNGRTRSSLQQDRGDRARLTGIRGQPHLDPDAQRSVLRAPGRGGERGGHRYEHQARAESPDGTTSTSARLLSSDSTRCLRSPSVLHREIGRRQVPSRAGVLSQHVAAGWLGVKTGRGFYRYEAAQVKR